MVVAMMVMAVILSTGLGVYGYVDSQAKQSAKERIRESALNLAESALSAQLFLVSRQWPGALGPGYPACSSSTYTSAVATQCPDPAALGHSFGTADYASGATWTTTVRDNSGSSVNFYDDAGTQGLTCGSPAQTCSFDANNDGKLWLRSSATVRGQTRTVIALAQVEPVDDSIVFPHNVITAGSFSTSNNGNKVIVNTQGTAAGGATLAVRCLRAQANCLGYDAGKNQVSPDTTKDNYQGGPALSPQRVDELRARAKANQQYYGSGSCPASLTGPLVFVENANCSYTGNAQYNSAAAPGAVIVANGSVTLGGTTNFYGVIYVENSTNSANTMLSVQGNASIQGAVAVDGSGHVDAGSSGVNITYDPNAFSSLSGYGNAGVVQNTWRELIAK